MENGNDVLNFFSHLFCTLLPRLNGVLGVGVWGLSPTSESQKSSVSGTHLSKGWKRRLSRGSLLINCKRRSILSIRASSCVRKLQQKKSCLWNKLITSLAEFLNLTFRCQGIINRDLRLKTLHTVSLSAFSSSISLSLDCSCCCCCSIRSSWSKSSWWRQLACELGWLEVFLMWFRLPSVCSWDAMLWAPIVSYPFVLSSLPESLELWEFIETNSALLSLALVCPSGVLLLIGVPSPPIGLVWDADLSVLSGLVPEAPALFCPTGNKGRAPFPPRSLARFLDLTKRCPASLIVTATESCVSVAKVWEFLETPTVSFWQVKTHWFGSQYHVWDGLSPHIHDENNLRNKP